MRTPLMLRKLVRSMLAMKPMVPNTRIGGKSLTGSLPAFSRALYATELTRAMLGMKKATLKL